MHAYRYSFCRSSDYVDESLQHAGRLPLSYALKDSLFGYKDVVHDALITFKGKGFSYSTFESSESAVHSGVARANRARAGLRYADGGKTKYWLPLPGEASRDKDVSKRNWKTFLRHPVDGLQSVFEQERLLEQGYSPLTSEQANRVVHDDPRVDLPGPSRPSPVYDLAESDTSSLEFDAPEISDDDLYNDARQLEFGDWRYPVYDATKEAAQRRRYEEEDEILFGRPPTSSSSRVDRKGKKREVIQTPTVLFPSATERFSSQGKSKESAQLPDGCVDLVVEDKDLEDEREQLERTKGDVTNLAGKERRAWRQLYGSPDASSSSRRPFLPEDHQTVEYTADDRESAQEDIVNQPQQFEESLTLATEVEPPKEAEKFVAPGV